MVVRDGADGEAPLEVLMVRRNPRAVFAGGAHVFPGGALDPQDAGAVARERCPGRDDAGASGILDVGTGGLAWYVAAVRECFEEAGLLLAYGPDGQPVSFADPEVRDRFVGHRRDLCAGRRSFVDLCRAEGLTLAVDRLRYVSHWITPEGSPRRFDTRFFVVDAPTSQVAVHDAAETVAVIWVTPSDALARHREGAIDLVLPTARSLEWLARFRTCGEALEAAGDIGKVPTVAPRRVAVHLSRTGER